MSYTKRSDAYEDNFLRAFAERENDYLYGDERYRQWCEKQQETNQPKQQDDDVEK